VPVKIFKKPVRIENLVSTIELLTLSVFHKYQETATISIIS